MKFVLQRTDINLSNLFERNDRKCQFCSSQKKFAFKIRRHMNKLYSSFSNLNVKFYEKLQHFVKSYIMNMLTKGTGLFMMKIST